MESAPKNKEVFYGIRDSSGKITKIPAQYPQKFSKKDLEGLNKSVKQSDGKNFIFYEEITKQPVTETVKKKVKGKIKVVKRPKARKKQGRVLKQDGKTVFERKTKITYSQAKKEQRPILVTRGKRVRALDIGFKKGDKRARVDASLLKMVDFRRQGQAEYPGKAILLEGETIRDTLNNVILPITLKQMKKYHAIRVDGWLYAQREGRNVIEPVSFGVDVQVISDFGQQIATAIRYRLADYGYRFTSLVKLYDLSEEHPDYADAILKVGKDNKPVEALKPIFPENEFGYPEARSSGIKVSIRLNIQPII